MLIKAIKIAKKAHEGMIDKADAPYIGHPLRVMSNMETEDEMIVAVLHDVLEDTEVTAGDLRLEGFSEDIIDAIESVSRIDENEPYDDFIKRACKNPIGKKVKRADLIDNMDLSRISNVTEKDRKRVMKYKDALRKIDGVKATKYIVYVDDNFHYMDEDERHALGEYDDCESAIEKCKDIIDRFLKKEYKYGMTAEGLYDSYTSFGDDPWISHPTLDRKFSAWKYAKERCKVICDAN